ncbi:arylamine N-acetyltransferase family protein [Longispora albida]|uniref:arylamine N-acetyltransferase family protein n=1 Tax=Longispora albida TaxID=203523 RepID=UPI000373E13D|nr:arylamine N-acetyltransferase [Longispora albida]
MIDVAAYLRRIGHSGPLTLAALHRSHLSAVPYEDLDIQLGRPIVPLTAPALFDKIVTRGRGGYCYELNGLFGALLETLGFEVTYLRATLSLEQGPRRFWGQHAALVVREDGQDWLADVGYGDGFFSPVPFREGRYEQDGFTYTLERSGPYWSVGLNPATVPSFYLDPAPMRLADFAPHHVHQWTGDSGFAQTLIVQRRLADRALILRGLTLLTREASSERSSVLESAGDFRAAMATLGVPDEDLDLDLLYGKAAGQHEAWLASQAACPSQNAGQKTGA